MNKYIDNLVVTPKRFFTCARYLLFALVVSIPSLSAAEDIDIYKTRSCPGNVDQEYRFIFVVDNSGSMSDVDFSESKKTIDASITHVLQTMPEAEVAVVQYGTITDYLDTVPPTGTSHDYDVTVPFTNNATTAINWNRQYGTGTVNPDHWEDHTPGSLAKMRIDNVYAPGGALHISDAENVQFVFFTDADRDIANCCSSLVAGRIDFLHSYVYPGLGEYDVLKNGSVLPRGLKAQFTVLSANTWDPDSIAASAAIASVGGSYTGAVEANAADPDGDGVSPRRFLSGTLSAANDVPKILSLLDDVITEITLPPVSTNDTFTQASIDINRASFSSDNRAFFSLFAPSDARSWRGNIKGYFIDNTGLIDTQGDLATVTDGSVTSFSDTAQSFWSAAADGSDVLAGGANEQIENAVSRTIYTHLGSEPVSGRLSEQVASSNTNITTNHLDVGTDGQRTTTLDWLQNAPLGDSLHSQPVLVRYDTQSVVYAATNQGILHAIDATNPTAPGVVTGGEELWGFMPKELLPNLPLLSGESTVGKHIYGLDGKITRWHDDENKDGIVNGIDSVLLIFGQRRGGRHYFALDVTNPMAPALKWQITGGTTSGFDDLMQTWSQPALITVAHEGVPATPFTEKDTQRVLAFGGGYDADTLDGIANSMQAGGGAIYIVDQSGALLWKTDVDMKYSMPADLTVIDSNDDAIADRIYAVDLGGQIWRVDLADMGSIGSSTVSLFAATINKGYQPFFYAPSVSFAKIGGKIMLAVIVGSGDRTNPLNSSVQNYLFMFKDKNVDVGPPANTQATINASTLYDVTNYKLGSSTPSVRKVAYEALEKSDGWLLKLSPGEMVLAETRVLEGVLLATTFRPTFDGNPNKCETSITTESRLYSMAAATGSPVFDDSGHRKSDEELTSANRSVEITGDGIPTAPQAVFPEGGNSVKILVGKDLVSEIEQRLVTVFWYGR